MHMISSWSCPTQTRPPNAGAGFVQVRRRVFIAKPQVWEHADQADQAVQPPWTVQFVTLTRVPVQLSPPCCGGGLLHSLVWHWHVSIFCRSNFQHYLSIPRLHDRKDIYIITIYLITQSHSIYFVKKKLLTLITKFDHSWLVPLVKKKKNILKATINVINMYEPPHVRCASANERDHVRTTVLQCRVGRVTKNSTRSSLRQQDR